MILISKKQIWLGLSLLILFSIILILLSIFPMHSHCFNSFCYFPFSVKIHNGTSSPINIQKHLYEKGVRSPEQIPTIIHQSWKTINLPSRFKIWADSWKKCFPGWTYWLWTDDDNLQFVKDKFPQYLSMYKNFKKPIYKIDTVRYLYLYEFGGIYADLDTECLKPFHELLTNHSIVFGGMTDKSVAARFPEVKTYVQNSLMISAPKHPIWIEIVEDIKRRPQKAAGDTTGPWVLMHTLTNHLKAGNHNIKIFQPEIFNPWSWAAKPWPKGCLDLNQMTDMNISECKSNFNQSYVLQYHTQTWDRGKISYV